jgi:hypothetical protein
MMLNRAWHWSCYLVANGYQWSDKAAAIQLPESGVYITRRCYEAAKRYMSGNKD